MGRKLPGRKHHGVRDPEKQREKRLSLKKFDLAPSNIDDQPIPKSALKIAQLVEKTKTLAKKNKQNADKKIKKNKKQPVSLFTQRKGESNKAFLYRCHLVCEDVKREVEFENKFDVKVKRNPGTGKIEKIEKRPKDPVELMVASVKKENKLKKNKKKTKIKKEGDQSTQVETKLTKSQKKLLKIKEKKKQKQSNKDQLEIVSDKVKFGEIVHAPPTLAVPKKIKKDVPGKSWQNQLLLKSLISPNDKSPKPKTTEVKVNIDKKGKRKNLPNSMRRLLDAQQKEIIDAYKGIKGTKVKNVVNS